MPWSSGPAKNSGKIVMRSNRIAGQSNRGLPRGKEETRPIPTSHQDGSIPRASELRFAARPRRSSNKFLLREGSEFHRRKFQLEAAASRPHLLLERKHRGRCPARAGLLLRHKRGTPISLLLPAVQTPCNPSDR